MTSDYFDDVLRKRGNGDLGLSYTEKRLMVEEIKQLRAARTAFINENQRLNNLLNTVYNTLRRASDHDTEGIAGLALAVVTELQELRGDVASPLADGDRVGEILQNVSAKLYDKKAREDIVWLTTEIGRQRQLIKWINRRLQGTVWVSETDQNNTRQLVDKIVHHFIGRAKELASIHDTLAQALGYEKALTAEEDPDCPCPGDYVTGDHTEVTLAMEAARKLEAQGETIAQLGQSVDRATSMLRNLEQQVTAAPVNPSELAAFRRFTRCICLYDGMYNRILPSPECPAHGVEANNAQILGQQAIDSLATLRRIILGQSDGE